MAQVLLAAQSRFETLCSPIHQTAVHLCFGPFVINKPLVLFFFLVGLKIGHEFPEGDLSKAGVADAPKLPVRSLS